MSCPKMQPLVCGCTLNVVIGDRELFYILFKTKNFSLLPADRFVFTIREDDQYGKILFEKEYEFKKPADFPDVPANGADAFRVIDLTSDVTGKWEEGGGVWDVRIKYATLDGTSVLQKETPMMAGRIRIRKAVGK